MSKTAPTPEVSALDVLDGDERKLVEEIERQSRIVKGEILCPPIGTVVISGDRLLALIRRLCERVEAAEGENRFACGPYIANAEFLERQCNDLHAQLVDRDRRIAEAAKALRGDSTGRAWQDEYIAKLCDRLEGKGGAG